MAIKIVDGLYVRDDSDWDIAFMEMAYCISNLSKDPSSKIGALLVSPCRKHTVTGFNGFPEGFPDKVEWWNNRDDNTLLFTKYELVEHAERNSIDNANLSLKNWSMYVTDRPCYKCALAIHKQKIKKVYYSNKNNITMNLNENKSDYIFKDGGIELSFIDKSLLFSNLK